LDIKKQKQKAKSAKSFQENSTRHVPGRTFLPHQSKPSRAVPAKQKQKKKNNHTGKEIETLVKSS
jgi:hypothetical protein